MFGVINLQPPLDAPTSISCLHLAKWRLPYSSPHHGLQWWMLVQAF